MLPDVPFPGLPGEVDYVMGIATFLQDRFLLATRYPFCPIQETIDSHLVFGLTEGILRKVMRQIAMRLFDFEGP